jgi:hypothetical protein
MGTVTLSDEQEARAREIYQGVKSGKITQPTDIVEWEKPTQRIDHSAIEGEISYEKGFIDPSRIRGPGKTRIHRLETAQLRTVLAWLIEGEYEHERPYPPVLLKKGTTYDVGSDGIHRCMAAKAIGLDKLYVEYEDYPDHALTDS